MKSNAQILSELRAWHKKWMAKRPGQYDEQAWDSIIRELGEIIPDTPTAAALFGPMVNRYIEDMERVSAGPADPFGYTE